MAVVVTTPVAGTNITDTTRLGLNAQLAPLATTNPALLNNLLAAASGKVKKFCKRDLVLTDYVEVRDGGVVPETYLHLQYPVVGSLARLATTPTAVLTVVNTNTAYQRADVSTTTSGITLSWSSNGTAGSDSSAVFATYTTLTALAAQINSLGNGWQATVQSGYEEFPSADLLPNQGGFSASQNLGTNGAQLIMYTESPTFAGSSMYVDGFSAFSLSSQWQLDANKGLVHGVFPRGAQMIRVDYRAGYTPGGQIITGAPSMPDEVQEACVLVAVAIYRTGLINPAFSSVRLGDASMTLATKSLTMPRAAKELLAEYVDHSAMHYN